MMCCGHNMQRLRQRALEPGHTASLKIANTDMSKTQSHPSALHKHGPFGRHPLSACRDFSRRPPGPLKWGQHVGTRRRTSDQDPGEKVPASQAWRGRKGSETEAALSKGPAASGKGPREPHLGQCQQENNQQYYRVIAHCET